MSLLLVGCSETSATGEPDSAGTTSDSLSSDGSGDAGCTVGEVIQRDCNTCLCTNGSFVCTELDCRDPGDLEACLAGCPIGCPAPTLQPCANDGERYCNACVIGCNGLHVVPKADLCDGTSCWQGETFDSGCNTCTCSADGLSYTCTDRDCAAVAECKAACGDGCPAQEFQLCGTDDLLYCGACDMACLGISAAPDRSRCGFCDLPAGDPAAVAFSLHNVASDCIFDPYGSDVVGSVSDETSYYGIFKCFGDSGSGINWGTSRLVGVKADEHADPSVTGVFAVDGEIVVYLATTPHCQGDAPRTKQLLLLLPKDNRLVKTVVCVAGVCPPGPPPP